MDALKTMSLKDLKQYCRDNNYKGHSKYKTKENLKNFIMIKDSEQKKHVICGKCSNRGHHSYECGQLDTKILDKDKLAIVVYKGPPTNQLEKDKNLREYIKINEGLEKQLKVEQDKVREYELKDSFEDPDDSDEFHDTRCNENHSFTFDKEYESSEKVDKEHLEITINVLKIQNKETQYKLDETEKINKELRNKYDNFDSVCKLLKVKNTKLQSDKDELRNKYDNFDSDFNLLKVMYGKMISDKDEQTQNEINRDKILKKSITPIIYDLEKRYGAKLLYDGLNRYHKNRYNLFIDIHNGMNKQLILFHGTADNNIKPIMENGFSLTTHKENGAVYGEGIYFTPNISFAMKYSKSVLIKNILVCQVYVNNMIEGKRAITTFPKIPGKEEYYDTGVDAVKMPNIYVKKSVEDINIIGCIQIDTRKDTKLAPKQSGLKIVNKTPLLLSVYQDIHNKGGYNINNFNRLHNMNIDDELGFTSVPIGSRYIVGYYDTGSKCDFNAIRVIITGKNSDYKSPTGGEYFIIK